MKAPPAFDAAAKSAEQAALRNARLALRRLLAVKRARAPGLAVVKEVGVAGAESVLRGRYYEAEGTKRGPLLLYFHGGGFVIGDIETHDSVCSWLAKSMNGRVLSVGYRLAPETRFPGQLHDARAACAWALKNARAFGASEGRIAVGGDSAGAYLAARCASAINADTPGAVILQVLLYPLVHIEDAAWAEEELRNFRFIGRIAASYIARCLGEEQFPSLLEIPDHAPTTIMAGGGPMDPVRADAKAYGEALKRQGVRVLEKKYPALMHGGLNFTAYSKTAIHALEEVGALIEAELS